MATRFFRSRPVRPHESLDRSAAEIRPYFYAGEELPGAMDVMRDKPALLIHGEFYQNVPPFAAEVNESRPISTTNLKVSSASTTTRRAAARPGPPPQSSKREALRRYQEYFGVPIEG